MGRRVLVLGLLLLVLIGAASSAPTSPTSKIVTGYFSDLASVFMKWLWSLKATTKTAVSGRPMVKFESGFTVETVFDGSKLGIEPHTVEVLPNGEILILDSANSNIYRMSSSLSIYSRPKLVAGSPEGNVGHIDGKLREARMHHPKGLTVDDRGNIYIADTVNMAIRKISDAVPSSHTDGLLCAFAIGVTTIAGGKLSRGGSHVDGPSEDAKFSNDFDVVYIGSSCSLLVIDRGNQAIREIQLHFDDCAYQYGSGFPLGIAMLLGAGFFGYMLALLQRRVGTIVSSQTDEVPTKPRMASSPYQKPLKSVMPPLIPTEDEQEKQEEGFLGSLGKLLVNGWASVLEILGKKHSNYQNQSHLQLQYKHSNTWPVQDSYVIADEDEPPTIETRTPTPRKTYAFMAKDAETMQQLRQSRVFYNGWGNHQQQPKQQQQQHYHLHQSSTPQTFYEQSCDQTTEIVFGAVQEQDGKGEAVVIKPIHYGDPMLGHQSVSYRFNSMGYPIDY